MKPFISCVFVACLSGALANPEWEAFKAKHGKNHAVTEDAMRMKNFIQKTAHIKGHNARYEAGLESFSLRPSQYSDLSSEEFARYALGFVPAVNASEIPIHKEPMMPSLPVSFDWTTQGVVTPVKNQGYCGSCYAFAGAAALENWCQIFKKCNVYDLSEQDVVDCSYKKFMGGAHNGGCQGGWPTAVYDYYNAKGLVPESSYPYTSGNNNNHGTCRMPSPVNGDPIRGTLKVRNVRVTEDEMADLLMKKGPLVVAIAADNEYKRFFDNLGDGVFDMASSCNLGPNHAVILVGFGVHNGKQFWLIKNSWGNTWAMKGYGRIARNKNMCNITKFGVWYVEQ